MPRREELYRPGGPVPEHAPGAIDPEAVLALLRQGHAPTLDNVYAMMRRREMEGADKSDEHEAVPSRSSSTTA